MDQNAAQHNAQKTKEALKDLDWKQSDFAYWLSTETGDDIQTRRIQYWLNGRCPGWPLALLQAHGLAKKET